jgi:arylsulfatase A-like enzyme
MHVTTKTLILSLALVGPAGCRKPGGEVDGGKPNFLVLIADDQRWDQLSCADRPLVPELETPHLDQLARQGVYFTNAFVTTPICAVSRASIMTGRYASTHGMNHFDTPLAPDVLAESYPAVLRAHGYRTGILGKWGMGIEGVEDAFDLFDAWAGQGTYFHETAEGRIHNAEWLARRTREFLADCTSDTPFCLTVCFKSPHHPYQPDERDEDLFEGVVIPPRETDTPAAYGALPAHVMDGSLNRWCYFDERGDEARKDVFEKGFLRCVASLDRAVGKILQALRELDLDEDTVVLFLSDNGYLWGEHGLGGKWLLYEESIRIPLILRGPGLPESMRGARPDALALNIDVAPTLLDLAGVPVPPAMDGESLLPLLRGQPYPSREDFFLEHVGVIDVEHPIPDSRAVRSRAWKYIRYVDVEPEVEQLYHLETDPLEANDLVHDPLHAATRQRLRERYDRYVESLRR